MDDLVQAMGGTDISKSQISRLCEEIDERVDVFLTRPIEGMADHKFTPQIDILSAEDAPRRHWSDADKIRVPPLAKHRALRHITAMTKRYRLFVHSDAPRPALSGLSPDAPRTDRGHPQRHPRQLFRCRDRRLRRRGRGPGRALLAVAL